jgi:hypothetical protein
MPFLYYGTPAGSQKHLESIAGTLDVPPMLAKNATSILAT